MVTVELKESLTENIRDWMECIKDQPYCALAIQFNHAAIAQRLSLLGLQSVHQVKQLIHDAITQCNGLESVVLQGQAHECLWVGDMHQWSRAMHNLERLTWIRALPDYQDLGQAFILIRSATRMDVHLLTVFQ